MKSVLFSFLIFCIFVCGLSAQNNQTLNPDEYTYAVHDSIQLKAYVYTPATHQKGPFNAIIIFYGGGWALGNASWSSTPAQYFTQQGLVSIAVDYRLSDEKQITPLDAMEDARDAIRWLRSNAAKLNINPNKIIGYGWSAGAHLVASAAVYNASDSSHSVSCVPDAMILESPAVSLLNDRWFRKLLLGKVHVRDVSPDENIRSGLPPTLLLQGELDTVTPLAGTERFYRRMLDKGNKCEMIVYKDYGHLFTPGDIPDNNWPQRDPKIQAEALKTMSSFIKSLGYIK